MWGRAFSMRIFQRPDKWYSKIIKYSMKFYIGSIKILKME